MRKFRINNNIIIADSIEEAIVIHKHRKNEVDLQYLINDEIEAIEGYRKMISECDNPALLAVLSHILKEETEHVEELRKAQAGIYEMEV